MQTINLILKTKNMKTPSLFLLLLTLALSGFSCTNDSENDLIEAVAPPNVENPEPETITYTNNVEAIIQSSCVGCHASPPVNGAPFALVNFDQVNQRSNGILNRMQLQSGAAGAMPPSGRLPQATINLIEAWIAQGKLEN
jgi:uncharacterized membrane protein